MTKKPVATGNEGEDSALTSLTGVSFSTVHVYKDDQQFGPYSLGQISAFLREGVFAAGDLAWVEGGDGYVPIENLSGVRVASLPQMEVTMRSI
jgi:hypothetical protein